METATTATTATTTTTTTTTVMKKGEEAHTPVTMGEKPRQETRMRWDYERLCMPGRKAVADSSAEIAASGVAVMDGRTRRDERCGLGGCVGAGAGAGAGRTGGMDLELMLAH